MKLLFIGNHFSNKRHNTNAWQELTRKLHTRGHVVLTTSGRNNKLLRLADMLVTVVSKRNQYQVAEVDVFSGPAFTWAYFCGRLLDILHKPFILTLHGGNLPEFAKNHTTEVSWLLTKARAVIAPSAYLIEKMKPYRENIVLIPNGIDLSSYPFIQRTKPKPILIWLRAFHHIYNPEMAINVLQQLSQDYRGTHLIMVGPDEGDGSLQDTQKLARQLGVEDAVAFAGAVSKEEVPSWLKKGDIFINTTNFDNTPISVLEAMACGLCVVSTNVGGIPYLLEDGVNALLVPPNEPAAMAAALLRLLTEPDLGRKISTNARIRIEEFDWSIILPKWDSLFLQVIRKKT